MMNANHLQTVEGRAYCPYPRSNHGTAFTPAERERRSGCAGCCRRPLQTLEQQAQRAMHEYGGADDLARNTFLAALRDRNEVCTSNCSRITSRRCCRSSTTRWSRRRSSATATSTSAPTASTSRSTTSTAWRSASQLRPRRRRRVDLLVATDAKEILGIGDWGVQRRRDLGPASSRVHGGGRDRPRSRDPATLVSAPIASRCSTTSWFFGSETLAAKIVSRTNRRTASARPTTNTWAILLKRPAVPGEIGLGFGNRFCSHFKN